MKRIVRNVVVAACLPLGACASIVDGQTQNLSVQTMDSGKPLADAQCVLTNNKGKWFVSTPGTVSVHRSYDKLNLKCTKDGFDPAVQVAKSNTKGMAYGNILFGGLIGAGVDMSTGAAYDYPGLITVPMTEASAAVADTAQPQAVPAKPAAVSSASDITPPSAQPGAPAVQPASASAGLPVGATAASLKIGPDAGTSQMTGAWPATGQTVYHTN